MPGAPPNLETDLLLEAIYRRYQYDFRQYARASIERRLAHAVSVLGCDSVSQLQHLVLHDPEAFPKLLDLLTIPVTEMFRDPAYFLAVRRHVVPLLATYPSVKLWVAGCSTGEEVYSYAILLREEGLLDRTTIYATDINDRALRQAERGVYDLRHFPLFTRNYLAAGGRGSLADHYTAAYGMAALDPALREGVVFSDHSLATDQVFAEVEMVSCRNVLIYFDAALSDRSIGMFAEALVHRGFLGLGSRESLRASAHAGAFEPFTREQRIYRRR